MALVLADRVKETTVTTGTGYVTLDGAVTGYQSFSVVGDGNSTYYTIAGQGTSEWEVGLGIYDGLNLRLYRDTVISSSSGGSKVSFSSGTKDVFVTYPASKSLKITTELSPTSTDLVLVEVPEYTITTPNSGATSTFALVNTGTSSATQAVLIATANASAGAAFTYYGSTVGGSIWKAGQDNATSTYRISNSTASPLSLTTDTRFIIDTSGNVGIGGTATRSTTTGAAHLDLFDGTAPAGTLTNGVSLYSSSGDLNFMNSAGNGFKVGFRNLPPVGTKTGSYTLATSDVGKYVQVGSGGSITIPDATFSEGDAVSIFNNTTGNITITCSITTAYIAGTDSDKATMTLATRGVATILFISGTVCVVSGNVS